MFAISSRFHSKTRADATAALCLILTGSNDLRPRPMISQIRSLQSRRAHEGVILAAVIHYNSSRIPTGPTARTGHSETLPVGSAARAGSRHPAVDKSPCPARANATASFKDTVDLPTPPFPDAIEVMRSTPPRLLDAPPYSGRRFLQRGEAAPPVRTSRVTGLQTRHTRIFSQS